MMNDIVIKIIQCRKYFCIFGAFLLHFSLGTIYTFGNMNPYIASYFLHINENVSSAQLVWIFGIAIVCQGISMPFGGLAVNKIGVRLTTLIGGWTMSFGVAMTYFSIKKNFILTIFTYGVLFGIGTGFAYSVAIAASVKWFPQRKGLIIGIVVGGFGLGSFAFNQVQTAFINPLNIKPNITIGPNKYFDDIGLLNRVPWSFVLLGGIYAVIQLIGSMLLFQPSIWDFEESIVIEKVFTESTFRSESIVNQNEIVLSSDSSSTLMAHNLTPKEAVRTLNFWLLFVTFLMNGTANVFITSLYKTFGQNLIDDDLFLAIAGSVGSVFNALSRVLWGQLSDYWTYRYSMRTMTAISAVFMGTFYTTTLVVNQTGEKIMFMFWVSLMLLTICGTFAMIPSGTAKAFGTEHIATIYGLVFISNCLAGVVGPLISTFLLSYIGYLGIFEIGAGCMAISFLITFFYRKPEL